MSYLRKTATMPLTLEADGTNIIKCWWADASYAVHPDMKSLPLRRNNDDFGEGGPCTALPPNRN